MGADQFVSLPTTLPSQVGHAGQFLETDGTTPSWGATGGSAAFDPTTAMGPIFDDFMGGGGTNSVGLVYGQFSWATQVQNAGSLTLNGSLIKSSLNHPGVLQLTSSVNTNDAVGISTGHTGNYSNFCFLIGAGTITLEALVYIGALSNGTDNCELGFGLSDAVVWQGSSNNARITYLVEGSNNWRLETQSAGTTTTVNSTIPVTTGWHHLKIVMNAAGTLVSAFIDGVASGTSSTNIPTIGLPLRCDLRKTLGTNVMYFGVDYISAITTGISR